MKKILSIMTILSISLFANKTDIYFGNGILTTEADAQKYEKLLRTKIKHHLFSGKTYLMQEKVSSVGYAYNQTAGTIRDLLESGLQKIIPDDVDNMRVWGEGLMTKTSTMDIDTQITAYQSSHDNGNDVIVVAHSQGNLFAIRAYKSLELYEPDWMHIIHVASPSHYFASNDVVAWDNDIVPLAGVYDSEHEAMKSKCLVRKVEWLQNEGYNGTTTDAPKSDYLYKTQVGYSPFPGWLPSQDDGSNSIVHAFSFYMGEPLKEDIANKGLWNSIKSLFVAPKKPKYKNIPNAIDGADLIDTQARDKILGYIKTQLEKNSNAGNGNGGDTGNGDGNSTTGGDSGSGGDGTGGDNGSDNSAIDFNFKTDCTGIEFPDPIPDTFSQQIENLIPEKVTKDMVDQICKQIKDIVDSIPDIPDGVPTGGGVPKIN